MYMTEAHRLAIEPLDNRWLDTKVKKAEKPYSLDTICLSYHLQYPRFPEHPPGERATCT